MDEKRTVDDLEKVFAAGEAWLRRYGQVTPIAHNSIVANLYGRFPKVKYVDYFLPRNPNVRKVWVNMHFSTWRLLFSNRNRLIDEVIDFLKEYLDDYDIQVTLRRYKRGVERLDEIPKPVEQYLDRPVDVGSDGAVREALFDSGTGVVGAKPAASKPDPEGDPSAGADPKP